MLYDKFMDDKINFFFLKFLFVSLIEVVDRK